jgi:putative redox protein
MKNRRLTFRGADGSALRAIHSLPADEDVDAHVLFAHCFTCSKDLKAVVNISRALTRERIGVFRFDFTGLGESQGEFADTTFTSNVEDLVAAAEFMERELEAPRILVGHSLGGAAVLQAAARIPTIAAVATIGAPFDPGHVTHLFSEHLDEIERTGEAEVDIGGRRFTLSRQFVRDLGTQAMEETIGGLGRPLLIFHSPVDHTVGIENAALIYKAARHPKSFVSLDGASHLLLDERDSCFVGSMLASWARRYLSASEEEPIPGAQPTGVVAVTRKDGYLTEIRARGHALVADEPEDVGGDDTGPTPYELLGAALGACTTMTLRMYADRKGWPLEQVEARLVHSRVHADDEAQCEDQDVRLDRLDRTLRLSGPLSDEQRARLVGIADRCPVHRTLTAGVRISTTIEEASEAEGSSHASIDETSREAQ